MAELQNLEVNLAGMVRGTRAARPHLRKSRHTAIVNTCSIAAYAGTPDRALHSASTGAVKAPTLAMTADHLAKGIRVNGVNPGTVDTPRLRRLLATADDPNAELRAFQRAPAHRPAGERGRRDHLPHPPYRQSTTGPCSPSTADRTGLARTRRHAGLAPTQRTVPTQTLPCERGLFHAFRIRRIIP
jgi:NAD(P)-dependent dehydrogenase (short-subunit alcohol dehydrogenase family)